MKIIKRTIPLLLVLTLGLSNTSVAFASSDNGINTLASEATSIMTVESVVPTDTQIFDYIEYEAPNVREVESPAGTEVLFTAEEVKSMSKEELINEFRESTVLDDEQIYSMVEQLKNKKNGISPMVDVGGIYDVFEWVTKPYIKSSYKEVSYAKSWIGIDAYRSSVGQKKTFTESITIKTQLGFTGSGEIKKFKPTLAASWEKSTTTSISQETACPAWTTVNWRPYCLYDVYSYYGREKITTYIPSWDGSVQTSVKYLDYNGLDKQLITDTTELWSRKNDAENVNAKTPQPPTNGTHLLP